jgi:hypothetical protein
VASVEQTIRDALWHHPQLFENRTQVLHHCLCITGSGYDWANGEMHYRYEHETCLDPLPVEQAVAEQIALWQADENRAAHFNDRPARAPRRWLIDLWTQMAEQDTTQVAHVRANLASLARTPGSLISSRDQDLADATASTPQEEIYPLNTQSALIAFPEDINEDWADAIVEMAEKVLAVRGRPLGADRDSERAAREARRNCALASEAITRVTQLSGRTGPC